MDFSDPRFWLDLLQWLIIVCMAAVAWLRKPGDEAAQACKQLAQVCDDRFRASAAEHDLLRQHVDEQHRDTQTNLAILRTHIEHMPTSDELSKLAGSVQALTASQEGFRNTQAAMTASLSRIENYLLNQK